MKLNIQMFAEADNADELDNIDSDIDEIDVDDIENEEDDEGQAPVQNETFDTDDANGKTDDKKLRTKAYSERLNADRERIREEERKKIREILEKEQKEKLDSIAKKRNFDSWEELEEFSEREQLEALGIEDENAFKEYLTEIINNNPEIKKAKEIIAEKEKMDKETYLNNQLKQISEINPEIKSLDDLVTIDKYDDFSDKVNRGYSLFDAYRLTYFDELTKKSIETAKQAAVRSVNSKSHMKSTIPGSILEDIIVPAEVMAMYKRNIPSMTDEAIKKHYAKSLKDE